MQENHVPLLRGAEVEVPGRHFSQLSSLLANIQHVRPLARCQTSTTTL